MSAAFAPQLYTPFQPPAFTTPHFYQPQQQQWKQQQQPWKQTASFPEMAMLVLAAASAHGGGLYHPNYYGYSAYHHPAPHVLTVLAERPLAASPVSAPVPLVVVPQDQIHVVHGDVSAPSRIKPYVQVKVQDHMEEAMPAIKVQLRRPIVLSSLHATIPFPTRFTVLQNGYSTPMHVGTLIAPLPTGTHITPNHPVSITYVYAIPASAPFQHYPAYYQYPQPSPSYLYYKPSTAVQAIKPQQSRPDTQAVEAEVQKPQDPQVQNRPGAPIVTVLDFPSNIASPPALFYQPPATGLGNREPPQAVAPAGIVQSSQPQPNLSVFVNSKESPYLQILRDEAVRNRNKQAQQFAPEEQRVFVN